MEETKDLRPCPFCGKSFQTIEIENGSYYFCCNYRLGGCGAASGIRENINDAKMAWNFGARRKD